MIAFTPPALNRRRWRQFSLRTLLIVVLIACLPLGWFHFKIERKRRQRRAADAITRAGGAAWYVGPAAVKATVSYHVKSLTGLQRLYLFRTKVTDVGLGHLTGLRDLEILHLGKTRVTFEGANVFEESLGRSPIIR